MTAITYARDHEALKELQDHIPGLDMASPEALREVATHYERLSKAALCEALWIKAPQ